MKLTLAFIKKEFLQIMIDPSSLIIAFILPTVLLFIYAYGLNMDDVSVRIGIKNDDSNQETVTLLKAFDKNRYITAFTYDSKKEMAKDMVNSKITAMLTIPNDFSEKLNRGQTADVQLITDGAEVNQVSYATSYVSSIVSQWLQNSRYAALAVQSPVNLQQRVWYNQEVRGVWSLVPASLAVTMTLIGILLTALVVASEWERGTMEALLSTNIRPIHIVIGKYVPYFAVGMLSLGLNIFIMICLFGIPFRGSLTALVWVSALFLYACLGIGLIISSVLKNQFLASIASLLLGFLPALMLSGLVFPIKSMPLFFQYLTLVLPPRHYVSFIRGEFLSGTDMTQLVITSVYLFALGFIFSYIIYRKTSRRLDV